MLVTFWFKQLSMPRQVRFMQQRGILLGRRRRENRQLYVYMFRNMFAEITYKDDNPEEAAENVYLISGLKKLNDYLEKELKFIR